jgi:DNA repair protein RadD
MKKEIVLRPYQNDAIERALWSIEKFDNNSLIVLPTGAGKSLLIAGIADNLRKEVLILQPSKEILEQNMEKLKLYVPEDEIGVYSASAKRKDINKYTFATIQSIYKKPELFNHIGLVLVDECHQVNPKNAKGMFSSFLKKIGNPVTIGLTATPFRNIPYTFRADNGFYISKLSLRLINRVNPRVWNRISYNINNHELVEQGYLTPLKYFDRSEIPHQRIPLNKSGTDFDLTKFNKMFQPLETQIIDSIIKAQFYRKAILVFCASLEQAERFSNAVEGSRWVSGETPLQERTEIIEGFKNGDIKVVFNMGVLTTGFDFPELDTIYLLRPTKSLGLYYQMLGRGVRTALDKKDCYVLDYSGSYKELGKIEDIKYYNENNYWEVYANGEKWHGKVIYERDL